uniref:Uncharacterized protein n=1 Tax=Arundo donax TaxID=35708 RepID=A0A0A9GBY9_ARUDO
MYYLVKSVESGGLFYLTVPLSEVASLIISMVCGAHCLHYLHLLHLCSKNNLTSR